MQFRAMSMTSARGGRPSHPRTPLLSSAKNSGMAKGRNTMQGPEDDAGLAGKVALISGGGAVGDGIGNGRAAAILLARAGAKVLVADRDLKLADRTAEMTAAEGGTAAAHGGDVTSEGDCKKLVEAALDRWGRLDF